ncbi:N-acyl homoserine lactonase family protein [Xanthobacter autotrophicus DSM 597]|uniref:N-acyl homoserine lactonase family protein n=1 Tax=Xanthobacter wiegelii TaxID=3119913 RepID=UPI00372CD070
MQWEVYALRYGDQQRTRGMNFIGAGDPHDTPMPLDFYVWLLRSGSRLIAVDTGFATVGTPARGRRILRDVATAYGDLGCDPAEVEDVIITHLHYDHAGNLDLFPKATFHLQEREMGFATGRHMCVACMRHAFDVEDVVKMVRALYAGRVRFHAGDGEVAPGVSVHHVGGHTDGLQMVRVETARGPLVLASDASHFYANMQDGLPFPIVFNVGDMAAGWGRARVLANGHEEMIVPGHDPRVRALYPAVEGSAGETVALHLPRIG